MATEPPPRIVGKFEQIWRDWLYYLYEFIESHTGGSTPTPPATGLSWNAHGNIATGDASNPLIVDEGTFYVKGSAGTTPVELDNGTGMAFIQSKFALRAGKVPANQGYWDNASIGNGSIGLGENVWPTGTNSIAMGKESYATNTGAVSIGSSTEVYSQRGVAIGSNLEISGTNLDAIVIGSGSSSIAGSSATNTVVVGAFVKATESQNIGIGVSIDMAGTNVVGLGAFMNATQNGAAVIGTGFSNFQRLLNNNVDTMWMAVRSTEPSIILKKIGTASSGVANIGIIEKAPLSTLDVGGSVGYKQDILTSVSTPVANISYAAGTITFVGNSITKTAGTDFDVNFVTGQDVTLNTGDISINKSYFVTNVTATVITVAESIPANSENTGSLIQIPAANESTLSDELVVLIDPDSADSTPAAAPDYIVHLPAISTVDRRMYHIKHNGSTTASKLVRIRPNVGDLIDVSSVDPALTPDTYVSIDRGTSLQIVANLTDGVWWVI